MSYVGHVENGVVVLENGMTLPEGLKVRIEPVEPSLADELLQWAGKGVDLPADLARRHDYYLHGREKA